MTLFIKWVTSVVIALCFCVIQAFAQPPHGPHGGHHHHNAPSYSHSYHRPSIHHNNYRYMPPPRRYDSFGNLLLRDLTTSIILNSTYDRYYYRTSYPSTEYTKQYWVDGVRYTCRTCSNMTTLNCNLESNMKCCECIELLLGK